MKIPEWVHDADRVLGRVVRGLKHDAETVSEWVRGWFRKEPSLTRREPEVPRDEPRD